MTGENRSTRTETSATMFATNPTYIDTGLNRGLCNERPATKLPATWPGSVVTDYIQRMGGSGPVLPKRYPSNRTDLLIRNYAENELKTDPAFPVWEQQYEHTTASVSVGSSRSGDRAGRG
jgi:hypothetical protein